jgi:hypothetical protein
MSFPDLKIYPGCRAGLFMGLAPDGDEKHPSCISLREDAFYLIEAAFPKAGLQQLFHWSETSVGKEDWLLVESVLKAVHDRIIFANRLDDIIDFGLYFPNELKKWDAVFSLNRENLKVFVSEFLVWLDGVLKKSSHIDVLGI